MKYARMKTTLLIFFLILGKMIFSQCNFKIKSLHIGSTDNCKGTAIIQNVSGKEPFTILWSNGQTSNVATNLCADSTYWAILTDANNCSYTSQIRMRPRRRRSIKSIPVERDNSVVLSDFSVSGCNSSDTTELNNSENNTIISECITTNCCLKFKGEVSFRNDTLFLTAIELGEPCRCLCTYKLSFEIEGLTSDSYDVVILKKCDGKDMFLRRFAIIRYLNSNFRP